MWMGIFSSVYSSVTGFFSFFFYQPFKMKTERKQLKYTFEPSFISCSVPTQEGDTDFTEGAELELVGSLQQRLGIGGVDHQRSRVNKLEQLLQNISADVAHVQLQHLPAPRLPRRPDQPITAERWGVRTIFFFEEQVERTKPNDETGNTKTRM